MMRSENGENAPRPAASPLKLLILAGTAEARALAAALAAAPRIAPRAALAGVTPTPAPYACPVRTGGFGGAAGLAAFLRAEGIGAVIDATHPFAARISANAAAAAEATGLPLLRLARPPWRPGPEEDWTLAPSLAAAAAIPPRGARVFLAAGLGAVPAFAGRPDLWIALRALAPSGAFPLARGEWVIGPPGESAAAERALVDRLGVDWLIAKNSGGNRAKLDACRPGAGRRVRVALVERPAPPPGVAEVETVAAAAAWAEALTPPAF